MGGVSGWGSVPNWFCRVLNNNEQSPIIKSLRDTAEGVGNKHGAEPARGTGGGPAGLAAGTRGLERRKTGAISSLLPPSPLHLGRALIIKFINQRGHEF